METPELPAWAKKLSIYLRGESSVVLHGNVFDDIQQVIAFASD